MRYAEIIHDSWQVTTDNPRLKWFIFVPSFIAVLIFALEVTWQLYLYLSEFGVIHSEMTLKSISGVFSFLIENNLLGWAIFGIIFLIFFGFILPAWVNGALILGVQQNLKDPEKKIIIRQKFIEGSKYFFPLFELKAVMGLFSFWSILLFMATFFRYFHDSLFTLLWPFFVGYTLIALLISTFLSFAPYFIVLEKMGLSQALKKSLALVFLNFGRTLAILLLMFLVNFRILINVLIILGVPLGIMVAITYFASSTAIIISIILGVVLLGFTAYLTALVEVFSTAVWTEVFMTMRAEQKQLESENEEN